MVSFDFFDRFECLYTILIGCYSIIMSQITNFMRYNLLFSTVVSAVALVSLLLSSPIYAQTCKVDKEVIMNFSSPRTGAYNVWDGTFGRREYSEEFVSGFVKGNGVVLAGYRFEDNVSDILFIVSALDRRGRQDWVQEHKIKGLQSIDKILPVGDGFWAIGRQSVEHKKRGAQVWIGIFDGVGQLVGQRNIAQDHMGIVPTDIIPMHDNSGFLLSANLVVKDGDRAAGSRVYVLNSQGIVQREKSFMFESETMIQAISPVGSNQYVVVGRIRDGYQRWAGWIMMLNKDGGIEWQRQYSRGFSAVLESADGQKNGDLVVSGVAHPAVPESDRGGWVMSVKATNGDVVWQRYYIGQSHYAARRLVVHDDGLISVLLAVSENEMQGEGLDKSAEVVGTYSHARLLTLSPRGEIIAQDVYFHGIAGDPHDLFLGKNNERVIVGGSQVGYNTEAMEDGLDPMTEYSQDLWVVAGAPADLYRDPCEPVADFVP